MVSDELDPLSTGLVYCELVCALQGLAQYDAAEEWTETMERWCKTNAIGSLHGRCRVHRAEILRLRGACDEAEAKRSSVRGTTPVPATRAGMAAHRAGRIRLQEETSKAPSKHCWPLTKSGGTRNLVSRWSNWPKETSGRRWPRYETLSSALSGCLRRSCHRTPSCSGRRCSRRRSRSRSRPATSIGPAQPPRSCSSLPPDSTARRWSPAPPLLRDRVRLAEGDAVDGERFFSEARDSGTKSGRPMKLRSHVWASPRPPGRRQRAAGRHRATSGARVLDGIEAAPPTDTAAHVADGTEQKPLPQASGSFVARATTGRWSSRGAR